LRSEDIKSVMKRQQWCNEELALALGVKIHAVWHWLAGRRTPRDGTKRFLELLSDFPELGPMALRYGRKKAQVRHTSHLSRK